MAHGSERLWTRGFILLSLSILTLSMSFYFLMPTLPVYATDVLGIDNSRLGLIIAVYTLAALLIRPFSGIALDLIGRKRILMISVWLFAIFFVSYHWAVLFLPLLVVRFFHGLQWGVASSAYFTAAVDIVPYRKRGRGIGYFGLAFNLAMAIGPAAGLYIMGDDRYTWLFMSGFGLSVIGAILLFFVKFPPFQRPEHLKFSWKGLLAKRSLPVSINTMLVTITFGGVITFLALYAREQELSHYTGWYFTLMAIGMGLARIFSGQIIDRFGPRVISMAGISMGAVGFWLLGAIPLCSCFIISAVVIGLGIGIVVPAFQTMANNVVTKERRGVANSTFLTGLDLGIGIGSLLTGVLADMFSLSVAFQVSTGILLFSLLFFIIRTMPHYSVHLIRD